MLLPLTKLVRASSRTIEASGLSKIKLWGARCCDSQMIRSTRSARLAKQCKTVVLHEQATDCPWPTAGF